MFLTLEDFLGHFPIINMSKDEFSRKFTVMYARPQTLWEIFTLKPALRGKPIIKNTETDKRYLNRDRVLDYFYEIVITERHRYLALFYKAYFEFKSPLKLDWSDKGKTILSYPVSLEPHGAISSQKNDASRRIIRNLFYLELLDLTKVTNTVKSHVSFWESLTNMYNKLKLEDRFFAPSSIDLFLKEKGAKSKEAINYNNLFYLFQAYQPKASIFNPYTIKWILCNALNGHKGASIFTPVLSWGSYLVAYMHSDYSEYVGVDVMPSVCQKVDFLANWYHELDPKFKHKKASVYCQPSESLLKDSGFLEKYGNHFDTILVCPPYYDMEIYHEGEQSINTYPDYQSWLTGYWEQTVKMCSIVSKRGGVFAFIGNDYHTLGGHHYPLTKDLLNVVDKYYQPVETYYLQNRTSPLRVNAKDRTERLYVYKTMDF